MARPRRSRWARMARNGRAPRHRSRSTSAGWPSRNETTGSHERPAAAEAAIARVGACGRVLRRGGGSNFGPVPVPAPGEPALPRRPSLRRRRLRRRRHRVAGCSTQPVMGPDSILNPSRSIVIGSPDIFVDPIEAQVSSGPETVHVFIEKIQLHGLLKKKIEGKKKNIHDRSFNFFMDS